MVKNRNNSSTRISANLRQSPKAPNKTKNGKNLGERAENDRITRSKRSRSMDPEDGNGREGPSKAKQTKFRLKPNDKLSDLTPSKKEKRNKSQSAQPEVTEAVAGTSGVGAKRSTPEPIVGSTKSLISSIKNGRLGKGKATNRPKSNLRIRNRSTEGKFRYELKGDQDLGFESRPSVDQMVNDNLITGLDRNPNADDGVQVGVNTSDDEFEDESDGEVSSDESINEDSSSSDSGSSKEEQLDRNDPRVKRLLEQIRQEDEESKRKRKEKKRKHSRNEGMNDLATQSMGGTNVLLKSPSDTTIYAPAVARDINTPPRGGIAQMFPRQSPLLAQGQFANQVSHFVESVRAETERNEERRDRSQEDDIERHQPGHQPDRTTAADRLVLEAEKFKAAISNPKGKHKRNDAITSTAEVPGNNDLSSNILELIYLLKDKASMPQTQTDNDDDFMHVTCHIDENLKTKIGKGEFVELDKLLPKSRNQIMGSANGATDIEVVRKDGLSFKIPENNRDVKISGIRKWEQAFRVYAAIYSEVNPQRSSEIWQYVHIINTAAASYTWENVAFYDYTFRQLMDRKPHRSWAKIYTQMWNLAMTDHLHKNNQNFQNYQSSGSNYTQNSNNKKHGDWRDKCCWRFNKGKCTKWNCRFDHRCNTKECGSYSHGANQCNKKRKGGSNNNYTQVKSERN